MELRRGNYIRFMRETCCILGRCDYEIIDSSSQSLDLRVMRIDGRHEKNIIKAPSSAWEGHSILVTVFFLHS